MMSFTDRDFFAKTPLQMAPLMRASFQESRLTHKHCLLTSVAVALVFLVVGCGGSTTDTTGTTSSITLTVADTFPSGLSVGVPTEVNNSTTVATLPFDGMRFASDWGRATAQALRQGDLTQMLRWVTVALPIGRADAAPAQLDLKAQAAVIEKVLSGDSAVSLDILLDVNQLFTSSNNATCYGPTMPYASHENAGGGSASGTLPSGDLGLWSENEGATTTPCIVAQLTQRVAGVKGRTKQGLMMMAAMRRVVAANSLVLPTAGNSLDLKLALQTRFNLLAAFTGVTVDAASIALDSTGVTYTYRLVLSLGSGALARTGEVILKHTPGAVATEYSGVMQVAGFSLTSDAAFGCSDYTRSGNYEVAQINTLKYRRDGNNVTFGSRDGGFCGAPATSSVNFGADVATFTSDGQLDPTVKITGGGMTPARGSTLGWRGNFTRFAGDYDKDTVDGSFLYAWQAGTGDSHSRALAAKASYNTATEVRSLNGYFAFADDISTTTGGLLGMICNWAGPGNSHTPSSNFQSQTATLTSGASTYVIATPSDSKITYAPTNSCISTTTEFDVDANGTLASNEGVGTSPNLDVPSGSLTVQQEVVSRGFSLPSLF